MPRISAPRLFLRDAFLGQELAARRACSRSRGDCVAMSLGLLPGMGDDCRGIGRGLVLPAMVVGERVLRLLAQLARLAEIRTDAGGGRRGRGDQPRLPASRPG